MITGTNERGAGMGSRSSLTTTEGIWQRSLLTLYFNSSRGESEPAKGGGRQAIPHPPIWTGGTSCLGERSRSRRPPWGLQTVLPCSCSAVAFLTLRGCLSRASLSPAPRHNSCFRGPPWQPLTGVVLASTGVESAR